MIATVVNVALVLVGSVLGLLFRRFISQKMVSVLTHALGLCVAGIGISSLVATQDMLCVIVCMVLGTVIGQGLDIEARLERGGALPAPNGDCGDVGGGGRPHCGHRHQHVGAGQREDPGGEYAPRHVPAPGVFPHFSRDRQPGVLGCRFFCSGNGHYAQKHRKKYRLECTGNYKKIPCKWAWKAVYWMAGSDIPDFFAANLLKK